MKQQKFQNPSTWHGLKKACQVEGRKTGGCFASQGSARTAWGAAELLCSGFCMQALCRFKGAGLIPLFLVSGIYLGDHWATDVLGGYLFGGGWLSLSLCVYLWLRERGVLRPEQRSSASRSY